MYTLSQVASLTARALAVAATLLVTSVAEAQSSAPARSNTSGLMLGAHLNGSAWTFEDSTQSGGGGGIAIGYGFTRKWQIFLNVDAAKIDLGASDFEGESISGSYTLAHADLGVRYSFASPSRAIAPYISAAVSSRVASAEVLGTEISMSGAAFTFGGGLQYFFTEKLALDAGLLFSTGKFDTVKIESITVDDLDLGSSTSTRFNIGLKFYPMIRR